MNIPIPQDIPGLITFWIFLSWIPLLRAVTMGIMKEYPRILERRSEDIPEHVNRYMTNGVAIVMTLVFYVIVTFALLGLRLLIQMLWC